MSINRVLSTVLILFFSVVFTGCADKGSEKPITYQKVASFDDPRGQGKIRIYMYSGEPELEDIKKKTEKLGCQMLFAYYYPESTDMNDIPVDRINNAQSLVEARDTLFKGEDVGRWHFGSQCFSLIPSVTNCFESPVSTNCR